MRSRKADRERQQDVEKQRQRHLQAKREEMEKRNQDVRDSREALLDNLANYGGLWKTKLQMDNEIGEKSNTQQLAALKTQINARKQILQQKGTH